MNFKISKRLETIGKNINKNEIIADIGTDHALVPIFLFLNQITNSIYATDVCQGPLDQAQKNIDKFLEPNSSIILIKEFGLKWLKNINIDTCVIAGMGANTILEILKDNNRKINRFILNANNQSYKLRKWSVENGYLIEKEMLIKENNLIYEIIILNKQFGEEIKSDYQIYMGLKLAQNYPDLYIEKNQQIIQKMEFTLKKMNAKISNYKKIENELIKIKKYYLEGLNSEIKRSD
ncbi:class I SAM-dependent methyltransferase [Spiroplasma endosymbiont of Amphibalanus improvisus]|uniref:tRNA (adenine(22)-N(1))-methyltransferase n=1 Tax=Spiroplasma endosymbiont of Amphibalanus improvisus TaxID=3066327 RepID=UPI00313C9998